MNDDDKKFRCPHCNGELSPKYLKLSNGGQNCYQCGRYLNESKKEKVSLFKKIFG